jgi:ketosteroid isomerase-like protein
MALAENKQVVRTFFDAGNRGDLESCLRLMADDVTWTNIGSTKYSGTYSINSAPALPLRSTA